MKLCIMKQDILYIDPQSYGNLAAYDYNLLTNTQKDILYIHSQKYDYKAMNLPGKPWFKYNKLHSSLAKVLSYALTYAKIFCLIMCWRPRIIHVQWFKMPTFDYYFYKWTKRLFRFRLVFTAHNVLPHNSGKRYQSIYGKLYAICDAIVVHTSCTKKEIHQMFHIGKDKIHVIEHGILKIPVDTQRYEQSLQLYRQKYHLQGKIVFVSLGEQSPYKGIDLLAKIWTQNKELYDNDDICLLLVGKQKEINLRQVANCKNVIVENRHIPNDEFLYLLRAADVYLLPYRQISQSGALLTAISERIPVLVSRVGGLTDPLKIAPIGWEIDKLDEKGLKEALMSIIKSPKKIKDIKENFQAWEKVAEHYSWKRIGNETTKLYNTMIGQS
jgi:D-inositol-3-phosphate glycosyltransferase